MTEKSGAARRTGDVRARLLKLAPWLAATPLAAAAVVLGFRAAVARAYRTDRGPHTTDPGALGLTFETVRFPTAGDRRLHAWWIPAAPEARNGGVVILLHGWNRNAERMLPFMPPLHEAGFDLLALDARCHGESECDGAANMLKFSEDLRAAVGETVRRGAPPGRIGLLGHSVGGAAAIHAGAHDPRVGAVVSVAAFAHPGDMTRLDLARRRVPAPVARLILHEVERTVGAPLDEIAPERHASRTAGPLLIVHGERDAIVPFDHARRLAAAAPDARRLVLPDRGHSDCDADPAFWPAVLDHLLNALTAAGTG